MKTHKIKLAPGEQFKVAQVANSITVVKALVKVLITSPGGDVNVEVGEGQRVDDIAVEHFFVKNLGTIVNDVVIVAGPGKFYTSAGLIEMTSTNINEMGEAVASANKAGEPQGVKLASGEHEYLASMIGSTFLKNGYGHLYTQMKSGFLNQVTDHDNGAVAVGELLNRVAARQNYALAKQAGEFSRVLPNEKVLHVRARCEFTTYDSLIGAFEIPDWVKSDAISSELYITAIDNDTSAQMVLWAAALPDDWAPDAGPTILYAEGPISGARDETTGAAGIGWGETYVGPAWLASATGSIIKKTIAKFYRGYTIGAAAGLQAGQYHKFDRIKAGERREFAVPLLAAQYSRKFVDGDTSFPAQEEVNKGRVLMQASHNTQGVYSQMYFEGFIVLRGAKPDYDIQEMVALS